MPLTGDQRRRLVDALIAAFPTDQALAEMVSFADLTPPRRLLEITTASGLRAQARELVERADGEGWLPDLVREAIKANEHAALVALLDEIKPLIVAAAANHYEVLVMGDRVLIDREPLRQALKRLSNQQKRIVIVTGAPVTGKTHTIWFIRHLRQQLKQFGLVWIDLEELAKAANGFIEPMAIAKSIVRQMPLDASIVEPKGEENWAAWSIAFCQTLTGRLATAAQPWWVVIDNFSSVALTQDTKDFVKKLCEQLVITLDNLSVILLSYDDKLPDKIEGDVDREQLTAIGPVEVGLFFNAVFRSQNRQPTVAEVGQKVAEVLRAVNPQHPRPLEALAIEVTRVAKQIVEGTGGGS
jgi:hypothetical protein